MKPTRKRGDKIYLDKNKTLESRVNDFLSCRDGIVEMYEYYDCEGYSSKTRLYKCQNTKHEIYTIVRQYEKSNGDWGEEYMDFGISDFNTFIISNSKIIFNLFS